MKQQSILKKLKMVDWWTLGLLFVFLATSMVLMAKTTADPFTGEEEALVDYLNKIDGYYIRRQLMFFGIGLISIAVLCLMDYRSLPRLTNLAWAGIILLLILVLFFGKNVAGTKRWFQFGNFNLQPSEYAKLVIIIMTAKFAAESVERHERIALDPEFFKLLGMIAIIIFLIMIEPDNGTAVVCLLIYAMIIFAGRLSIKAVLSIAGLGLSLFAILFFTGILPDYARMRIVNFLGLNNQRVIEVLKIDPTKAARFDSTQVDMAKQSMAAGGMWGKGFFSTGSNAQLRYLPEAHTDFIFAAAVETFGFAGGVFINVLYLLLLGRCMMLAFRARDNYGYFIIVGVVSMLFAHIFENIGMNIGIMPVTGIPLPLISYGGSSLWANMLAIGLVLMVNMQRDVKRRHSTVQQSEL